MCLLSVADPPTASAFPMDYLQKVSKVHGDGDFGSTGSVASGKQASNPCTQQTNNSGDDSNIPYFTDYKALRIIRRTPRH